MSVTATNRFRSRWQQVGCGAVACPGYPDPQRSVDFKCGCTLVCTRLVHKPVALC